MKNYSAGSIRKRPKSKNSTEWEWQGFINVTENGKHRQLTKMTGIACTPPTKNEKGKRSKAAGKGSKQALDIVKSWRDELVAADAATIPNASDETVVEFVRRYIRTLTLEPSTQQTYKYLLPYIEMLDMPIAELTPQHAEQWKLEMAERGYGDHMKRKAFNLLKYACTWGVGVEAIMRNPLAAVKAPPQPKHEPNPIEISELPRLISLLDGLQATKPEFADLCLLALNTGMRRGELCALRWCDIDGYIDGSFEGCIHVNRVIAHKDGGTYVKDYPKNGHRRQIDINEPIRAILSRRRNAISAVANKLADCYVFAYQVSPDSYPAPSYITRLWNMFASMNDIIGVEGTKLRLHDLRDTFATSALVNGVPVVTVSSILGHSSTTTTLRHYAHFMPSENKAAMDAMGKLLNAG